MIEVIGTTLVPKPNPAKASVIVSHPDGTVELSSRQESRIPSPGKHAAFRHRKARADSGDAAPRKDSGEGHRRGHRQELERDVVGRVTDHRGEVERGEKEDRKNPKEEQESDHDCACEPGLAKVRQVEHRCFVRTLNADKTGERDDADDEKDDDGRRAITQRLTEDDREGERAETGATRQEAGDVEWNRLRIGALADHSCGEGEDDEPHRDIEPAHQRAADHGTEREREARNRAPDTECAGSLLFLGIEMADDREGSRLGGGGSDTHDDPAGDEHGRVRGQCPEDGAGDEDEQAEEHHPSSTNAVRDRPCEQHQAREGERVTVYDPLELCHAGMEAGLHVGERDAHDCHVQEGEEQHRAQDEEREAPRKGVVAHGLVLTDPWL